MLHHAVIISMSEHTPAVDVQDMLTGTSWQVKNGDNRLVMWLMSQTEMEMSWKILLLFVV